LVEWSNIITNLFFIFLRKIFKNKIWISIIINGITYQKKDFDKAKTIVYFWIYAKSQQKEFFLKNNIIIKDHIAYNPFYVDEKIFKKVKMSKRNLCSYLSINHNKIKNKILIGSFQKDSIRKNLLEPKWQKNPDLLVDIAIQLKNKGYNFILILAGPKKHYIIKRLEEEKLPYIFIGVMNQIIEGKDDISTNNLPLQTINLLIILLISFGHF